MDDILRDRYFSVRRKLADLNYPTSFGADSLELVEKLVSDLSVTTDSYKQVQEKEISLSNDLSLAQVIIHS